MLSAVFRSRWFWCLHVLVFLVCTTYALRNFRASFPFVDVTFSLDRKAAGKEADRLFDQWGSLPESKQGARQAVEFTIDSATQNFIELETGGASSLERVLKTGVFSPYTWSVRRFAEGKVEESWIRFRPDGRRYSFYEKLSEDTPGVELSVEEARRIAETHASQDWSVDFSHYRPIETQRVVQRGKRVDYGFTYELQNIKVGEAPYRLKLGVSGDRFTELSPFIQVPQSFKRKYSELRASNLTLASAASTAVALIYGILGCFFGVFWLARSNRLDWKKPLFFAAFISVLKFFDELNDLPSSWMSYDTALPAFSFVLENVIHAALSSLLDFMILAVSLVAAEGLSRAAFPNHPQWMKLYSAKAGPSRTAVGYLFGAILLLGVQLAFLVWIYGFGARVLGWWNPSEMMFHPDALATPLPWLSPVAKSLHAGVWEESLFRAVPLSIAMLLGTRWGRPKTALMIGFLLQAVIFGAAHANYPTQPAYARLVELIFPSFVFAGLFLRFGLWPGIYLHYCYDVLLFSLPLFLSEGVSKWTNTGMVIGLSLFPLLRWGWQALRAQGWFELAPQFFNREWQADESKPIEKRVPNFRWDEKPASRSRLYAVVALLCVALVGFWHWKQPSVVSGLRISAATAEVKAREALKKRGVVLSSPWKAMPMAISGWEPASKWVFKTQGKEVFQSLLGRYLSVPHWTVRFARFEGTQLDRAEEYAVVLSSGGEVDKVQHVLAEGAPGAQLNDTEARALGERLLQEQWAEGLKDFSLMKIEQVQRPNRRDWLLVWKDLRVKLANGDARVTLKIQGDQPSQWVRSVEIPEEWARSERSRTSTLKLVRTIFGTLAAIFFLLVIGFCVISWIQGSFQFRMALIVFGLALFEGILGFWNSIPIELSGFTTAQGLSGQWGRELMAESVKTLLGGGVAALLMGHFFARVPVSQVFARRWQWRNSLWVGASLSAVVFWAKRWGATLPDWPQIQSAALKAPALEQIFLPLHLALLVGGLGAVFALLHRLTDSPRRRILAWVLLAVLVMGAGQVESWSEWGVRLSFAALAAASLGVWVERRGLGWMTSFWLGWVGVSAILELGKPAYPEQVISVGVGLLTLVLSLKGVEALSHRSKMS